MQAQVLSHAHSHARQNPVSVRAGGIRGMRAEQNKCLDGDNARLEVLFSDQKRGSVQQGLKYMIPLYAGFLKDGVVGFQQKASIGANGVRQQRCWRWCGASFKGVHVLFFF